LAKDVGATKKLLVAQVANSYPMRDGNEAIYTLAAARL